MLTSQPHNIQLNNAVALFKNNFSHFRYRRHSVTAVSGAHRGAVAAFLSQPLLSPVAGAPSAPGSVPSSLLRGWSVLPEMRTCRRASPTAGTRRRGAEPPFLTGRHGHWACGRRRGVAHSPVGRSGQGSDSGSEGLLTEFLHTLFLPVPHSQESSGTFIQPQVS